MEVALGNLVGVGAASFQIVLALWVVIFQLDALPRGLVLLTFYLFNQGLNPEPAKPLNTRLRINP